MHAVRPCALLNAAVVLVLASLAATTTLAATNEPARTVLGIEGTRFTINGKAAFLYGASYYGALGASEDFIRKDLDDMQRHGFNWIRVWANWAAFTNNVAAVDEHGRTRADFMNKLRSLIAECDRRGMIVDVTLSRGNGITGPARLQTLNEHRSAVRNLVNELRSFRNWYLDLSNERNINDKRFASFADLAALREEVRILNPRLLVTASHAGDISADDLQKYVKGAGIDFIAPHRPRDAASPAHTQRKTADYRAQLRELGSTMPVHYQEPFRRAFGPWQPSAEDFVTDARAALKGGAAGWCFHNGDVRNNPEGEPRRSFDLRRKRLFEQLDAEEVKALETLKADFATATR